MGDYDLRGSGIEDYYAAFGRKRMADFAIVALADASLLLPKNHIGFEAWITMVAGVDMHADKLKRWAVGLARALSRCHLRQRGRRGPTPMAVPGWRDAWGDQSALDGLAIAIFGKGSVPGINQRTGEFGCHAESYLKVRAFVSSAIFMQASEFSWAIRKVVGKLRFSAVLDEILKIGDEDFATPDGFQTERLMPVREALLYPHMNPRAADPQKADCSDPASAGNL